jgi:hypothetical protein
VHARHDELPVRPRDLDDADATVGVDAAAMRAIDIGARTYSSVKSILANNLD